MCRKKKLCSSYADMFMLVSFRASEVIFLEQILMFFTKWLILQTMIKRHLFVLSEYIIYLPVKTKENNNLVWENQTEI